MNLNLHNDFSNLVNLGMIRIKGSMPAERAQNMARERLHEFGLDMKNIAAFTTDGASVIKSFDTMICCIYQLSFAHGYHLAVTDFLYVKTHRMGELEEIENPDTGSDSEFFSEEGMEEVGDAGTDAARGD